MKTKYPCFTEGMLKVQYEECFLQIL